MNIDPQIPANGGAPIHPSAACYPRRRSKGPAFWIAIAVTCLFLVSLLINFSLLGLLVGGGIETEEVIIAPGDRDAKIAVIPLHGAIMGSSFGHGASYDPVELFRRNLEAAKRDGRVKAVVIEVDSPGGLVTAFDRIHKYIGDFKASSGKKVMVSMGSVAASGGYYASVAADYLYAEPTTWTGSIGVIIPRYDVSGALGSLNIKYDAIKSGKSKDSLSMSVPLQGEQREHMQKMVNEAYDKFVGIVLNGRGSRIKMAAEEFRNNVADGRIISAQQALHDGLIDEIGYLEDAYNKARNVSGASNATVVRYSRRPTFLETILSKADAAGFKGGINIQFDLASMLDSKVPRLMYLWTGE